MTPQAIPFGYCHCGCGEIAPVAHQSETRRGFVKGQPYRFIAGHNQRRTHPKGDYRHVRMVTHPKADKNGCVYAHVAIAERALGHYLPNGAEVHHVDEDGTNNSNTNLVVCQDRAYHKLLHVRARVVKAGGNPNTQRICCFCKSLKPIAEFNRRGHSGRQSGCRPCLSGLRKAAKAAQKASRAA